MKKKAESIDIIIIICRQQAGISHMIWINNPEKEPMRMRRELKELLSLLLFFFFLKKKKKKKKENNKTKG